MCILYPGIQICVASGNKKQAGLIITDKVAKLMHQHPILKAEMKDKGIKTYHDNVSAEFRNGSTIFAVTSNNGARGVMAHILIVDEFRMVDKDILDAVLKPFLTGQLTPPFHVKPEYVNYPKLPTKEIYLSSAWLKSHWSWDKVNEITKMMLEDRPAFSCNLDYHVALDHGLVTQDKLDADLIAMGKFKWEMEYGSKFFGENENSFYKSNEINECRVLKNAYYPLTDDEYRDSELKKKRLKQLPKKNGEIRIIGVDVAVQKSSKTNNNDNSVYTLMRLLPNGDGYTREIVHMESYSGMKIEDQAIRLKRLYTEFQCDYQIIDGNGVGFALIEEMQKNHYDKYNDEHYEPFGVYDCNVNSDFEPLKEGNNCIYMMKSYEKTNNDICVYLKSAFASKKIRLLIDESKKQADFVNDKKFQTDGSYQSEVLLPFIQTSQFVFETLNLEYEVRPNGNIAIKEKSGNRKDRFSSVAYANYLAELLEKEERKRRRKNKSKFIFIT